MEVRKAAGQEPLDPEAVHRALDAETCERDDPWLTDGQLGDAGVSGQCRDRLEIGLLDLAVIADGVLAAPVVPVLVTVGGVVLGDAVDVGKLHVVIFQQ